MKRKLLSAPLLLFAMYVIISSSILVQAGDTDSTVFKSPITIKQDHEYHIDMDHLFEIEGGPVEYEASSHWMVLRVEEDTLYINASSGISESDSLLIFARGEGYEEKVIIPVKIDFVEHEINTLSVNTDSFLPLSGIFVVLIGVSVILLTSRLAKRWERSISALEGSYHC